MNNIALDKQVNIYSIDTSAFYTDEENKIEYKINLLRHMKAKYKKEKEIINQLQCEEITQKKAELEYRKLYRVKRDIPIVLGDNSRLEEIDRHIKTINQWIPIHKENLIRELQNNTEMRQLRKNYISDKNNASVGDLLNDSMINKNVISVFISNLTRVLEMNVNLVYADLIIVKTYYFDVLKDIVLDGFIHNGEKYICFTASAGQLRTKKAVFIKEKLWFQYQKSLMCGLTLDRINELGGVNINKYFAYLALCNSATDIWEDFNIRKSIVVDDMKTVVRGLVDYIDDVTYTIERKEMDIEIEHTDGCGMILGKRNFMGRLPWIKGLMAAYAFDKHIKMLNELNPSVNHGIVTDIYGKQHDIIAEGIEVIFTKSQFKMWKYYSSWQEYIDCFEQYKCFAGKCNEEPNYFPNAKLNYQMIQTLTDMTDDELKQLCRKSISKIENIASNKKTMLSVFGATNNNIEKNSFQKCLALYPEMLSDAYTKETLKQIKKSLTKEYRSGKLEVNGKYLFIIPDMYAFCEWLFLGDRNPKGLLQDGEVFCKVYRDNEKLDCLRSPHLYKEHAVRRNIIDKEKLKWFTTSAIYTSCHDLISKILQFDCDGDKSLVCADPLFIEIAERNMQGVVPLFYNMKKADAKIIDNKVKYDGLRAAYAGGNIGVISNEISKEWNQETPNMEKIKILCMENNFQIDYAKTLYKPDRPTSVKKFLFNGVKFKLPHFFIYAKDKAPHQVEPMNNSVVNRIVKLIPDKKMSFNAKDIGVFDYKTLMNNPIVEVDMNIVNTYNDFAKKQNFRQVDNDNNNGYLKLSVIAALTEINADKYAICDMLIKYLFDIKKSKHKNLFWLCFGDIVYENLKKNLKDGFVQCKKCGRRFLQNKQNNLIYCNKCSNYQPIGSKSVTCIDCKKSFTIDSKKRRSDNRCDECYKKFRTKYCSLKKKEARTIHKTK